MGILDIFSCVESGQLINIKVLFAEKKVIVNTLFVGFMKSFYTLKCFVV